MVVRFSNHAIRPVALIAREIAPITAVIMYNAGNAPRRCARAITDNISMGFAVSSRLK